MLFHIFMKTLAFLENASNFPCLWFDFGIFLHANFLVAFSFCRTVILNSYEAVVVLFLSFHSLKTLHCLNHQIYNFEDQQLGDYLSHSFFWWDNVIIKCYHEKGFTPYRIRKDTPEKYWGETTGWDDRMKKQNERLPFD